MLPFSVGSGALGLPPSHRGAARSTADAPVDVLHHLALREVPPAAATGRGVLSAVFVFVFVGCHLCLRCFRVIWVVF